MIAEIAVALALAGPVHAPIPEQTPEPVVADYSVWLRLADCESGDINVPGSANWTENAGTIFDGGIQFHPGTWLAYGGGEFAPEAWMATREQQIIVGIRTRDGWGPHAGQGWGAWPSCAARLGLI